MKRPSACLPERDEAQSLLAGIESPRDLRRLSLDELAALAAEIRRQIVAAVAANGGHLGSNLGVVELTLALHRVFDSPKDLILWDTGHQTYAHKMLTGRSARFATLRRAGGLSGYPSRAESGHDWVENSHASTILSYAHGLARSLDYARDCARRIVAVLGDGALTGGMAYEALNNLGHSASRVVIVFNDNGRSYSPTIGRLSARRSRDEQRSRARRHGGALRTTDPDGGADAEMEPVSGREPEPADPARGFFEALGVRYIGPVDGHDIAHLEAALCLAAQHNGPVVLHALTQKGRGYGPAENDVDKCLHDAPVFDPLSGPPTWAPGGYTGIFAEAIVTAGERDPRVAAISAAMAGPTGLTRFRERWPDRFLDAGIAEQHAVTAAAGMAMAGLRPVLAVYSSFLTRAFDQINLDVGLHRLPVLFCIDRAGITGEDGPSHHGVLDIALLSQVPGMTIFAPSSAEELGAMLEVALELDGPAAIRYPKGRARPAPSGEVGAGLRARLVRRGHEVCILAVGKLVEAAEEAADLLAGYGVSPTVWDVRIVKPIDPAMLESAATHRLVVTAEDGARRGGAGSSIQAALADRALERGAASVPVLTLGLPDAYLPHGRPESILSELGLDGPGIAASILAAVDPHRVAGRA